MKERRPWTKQEEEFLVRNFSKLNVARIMKSLNRSLLSIKRKAHDLSLYRDVYDGGFFLSTGDFRAILGIPKTTTTYYIKKGLIHYSEYKSFNKTYKRLSPQDIIDFMYTNPSKWIKRDYDIEAIQMLMMDCTSTKKVDFIKKCIGKKEWRTKMKTNRTTLSIPTISEKLSF